MSNWTILLAIIAVTNGQPGVASLVRKNQADTKQSDAQNVLHKSDTIIENKNVNILVNVDAKAIAEELWKVIEAHLKLKPNRRSFDSQVKLRELENIVSSILTPSRRGSHGPSPFEIAHQLDHVARSAISNDGLRENSLDTEIVFRNIVSEMLEDLKGIMGNEETSDREKSFDDSSNEHRRGLSVSKNNNEFVDLKMRILKEDLAKAVKTSLDRSE
ncbi:uncharacterized protein LOC107264230 [Cephus cinctus]|uniref:Uncharacterized protein LOC107264230 n=1 Tax=Cephus cinctus TaxID=211228 RepID=A0AAJ7FEG2_CEPCN|nr:uncharacterized protein LOC107264230 [Cephus cinctus]